MKKLRVLLITGIIITGFGARCLAQEVTLPEITVKARTYKYLRAVGNQEPTEAVKLLQQKAAAYDIKNSEYYSDDYGIYSISFFLPQGYILAVYDSSGKLLSTAERYEGVSLPSAVRVAVAERYPNWGITKGVYVVTYSDESGSRKVYKLELENGRKRLRVKASENGDLL